MGEAETHLEKITRLAAELVAAERDDRQAKQLAQSYTFAEPAVYQARAEMAVARVKVAREEALEAMRQLAWERAKLEAEANGAAPDSDPAEAPTVAVGQWWRHRVDGTVARVVGVDTETSTADMMALNRLEWSIARSSLYKNWEPWTPRVGEWVRWPDSGPNAVPAWRVESVTGTTVEGHAEDGVRCVHDLAMSNMRLEPCLPERAT